VKPSPDRYLPGGISLQARFTSLLRERLIMNLSIIAGY